MLLYLYYNSRPALFENRLSVVQKAHPGLQSSALRAGVGFFAFSGFFYLGVESAGRSLSVWLRCISVQCFLEWSISSTRIASVSCKHTHPVKFRQR